MGDGADYSLGDDLYCKALNGRAIAIVHVLEPKGRDKKMAVVEAGEMASAIDLDGSVALYGIFFDTGKAEPKPESEPTLKEIAGLMAANPALVVLVRAN